MYSDLVAIALSGYRCQKNQTFLFHPMHAMLLQGACCKRQENDEVQSTWVQHKESASKDEEGSPEAEGAPETPWSSQVGSLHLACLYLHGQLRYHGVYYAGRLFHRAAGHK